MTRKINHLGIFDSGLGGYTVFHDLKQRLPELSLTLLADQGNTPYGSKSREILETYAKNAADWFYHRGIHDVLVACNTISANALDVMKAHRPSLRIWGIIDLTVSQLPSEVKRVGVFATQATCKTGAYTQALQRHGIMEVEEKPLPDLVSLIETLAPETEIEAYINENRITMNDADALILGCTHYPLAQDVFEAVYPKRIYDSLEPIYRLIAPLASPGGGQLEIYTTGDAEVMQQQIMALYGTDEQVKGAF